MSDTATEETNADENGVVLVVEDERELRELYATWLESEYEVRTAATTEEGIAALDADVDVALLDRRLPDGSGDEVLTELRNRGLDCRVAMITAVAPDFDILDMGFDDYLVKPVSRDELLGVVETMRSRRTYDERARRYAALVSKHAALGREKSEAELAASEEYTELEAEIEELREELDSMFTEFDDDDFEAAFLSLDSDREFSDSDGT